jgi:sigma-54 dependent transcriptional regulator, acetoin dehydrogenase operon transcriptional activator AcoR
MESAKTEFLKVFESVLGVYGFSPFIALAMRFFLRNPYESLVIVNKEGKLEFMDRGSEKFLGLAEGEAKGVKITDLIPDSGIPKLFETGVPTIGRIFDVNGVRRIGSLYPLAQNKEVVGAVGRLIFHSLEELERINSEVYRLKGEVKSLREKQKHQYCAIYSFENILGTSAAMKEVIELSKKAAMTDADVLIIGESGTGKELLAQAIHSFVNPEKPFITVNSSAIPFELAESELFGYEKGTFTGANPIGKPGKFELARNGTFFLDEISSLPLSIQAKLLRVLQEREVERLGGIRVQKIDFRLVGATNTELRTLVEQGKFREDLYYRIAKAIIHIPPLRTRKEDIPVYISYFLKTINARFGTKFERLTKEALSCLMDYDWPGNVRELINVLEQSCLRKWEGVEIPMASLPPELLIGSLRSPSSPSKRGVSPSASFRKERHERESKLILQALEDTKGNKRKAASRLGIPRSTLYNKLKEYHIEF